MSTVTYSENMEMTKVRNTLLAEINAKLRVNLIERRTLKAEKVQATASDREAKQAKLLADGGTRIGVYVYRTSGRKFHLIPNDPAIPETRGEAALLAVILAGLKIG